MMLYNLKMVVNHVNKKPEDKIYTQIIGFISLNSYTIDISS